MIFRNGAKAPSKHFDLAFLKWIDFFLPSQKVGLSNKIESSFSWISRAYIITRNLSFIEKSWGKCLILYGAYYIPNTLGSYHLWTGNTALKTYERMMLRATRPPYKVPVLKHKPRWFVDWLFALVVGNGSTWSTVAGISSGLICSKIRSKLVQQGTIEHSLWFCRSRRFLL